MDFATTFGIFLASLFVLSLITYKAIQFLSSGSAVPQIRRKPYSAPARSYKDDILMESSEIRYSKEIEPAKPGEDLMDIIQSYEEEKSEEKIVKEPLEKTIVKEEKLPKPNPVEEFLEDIFGNEGTEKSEETEKTDEVNQSRENQELEHTSWHLTELVEDESVEELTDTDRDMSPGRYPECFGTDIEFERCGKDCGVAKDCSRAIHLLESI